MKRDKQAWLPGNSATLALLLLSTFWASDVAAHEIIPGVTGFPALMLHPLLNQFQLLAIIVVGLAIASGRPPPLLHALVVVPSAMIAGNLLVPSGVFSPMGGLPAIALAALLVSGAIVAAFEELPVAVVGIIAGLLALLIGVDTVPEYPGTWGRAQTILATALTTIAMFGFISYVLGAPRPLWRSVAARMISAWVFAAAVMMLALLLKPHTAGAG